MKSNEHFKETLRSNLFEIVDEGYSSGLSEEELGFLVNEELKKVEREWVEQ